MAAFPDHLMLAAWRHHQTLSGMSAHSQNSLFSTISHVSSIFIQISVSSKSRKPLVKVLFLYTIFISNNIIYITISAKHVFPYFWRIMQNHI